MTPDLVVAWDKAFAAGERYGIAIGHLMTSSTCWCDPEMQCAECGSSGPCLHGVSGQRVDVISHKDGS